MEPGIIKKWQAAAQELWEKNPELRSRYHHDLQAYLNWVLVRIEAQEAWRDNPQLRKEFSEDFNLFLTYRKAESQGQIRIIGENC